MYYYKARIYSPKLGRFMQTDPIGYEDQYNLYAYVGNDPINAVDPTGESCGVVNKNASCKVDDRAAFEKAGWSSKQISDFEAAYTRTVNKLRKNGDKVTEVEFGGKSFRTTAEEVAKNLANTWVTASSDRRDGGLASMDGGPGTLTRGRGPMKRTRNVKSENPGKRPFIMNVKLRSRGRGSLATQITIVHEGLHSIKGHSVFNGMNLNSSRHRRNFNRSARELLGLPAK